MSGSTRPFAQAGVNLANCALASPMSAADAESLGGLLSAMQPWSSLNISASALGRYPLRADPALSRYAVRVDGHLAGVVCVRYPWLRGPYIELLGLAGECQGRGLGRELLDWVEAEARLASNNLWVMTSSFNHKALGFYQRLGFAPVGQIPGLIDPGHDEILLHKRLD